MSECLYDWLNEHLKDDSVIAIDDKTIRGNRTGKHRAYHMVSAFVAENQIILDESATEEKSDEITAIPELLQSINIESSIITADAMSYRKEIVQAIVEKNADYCIVLKDNHPSLLEDVSLYF